MNQPISDIFSSQDTTKLLTFVVPPTRFIADATVPHSLVQNQYENLLAMVQKNVQDIQSLQLETMSLKNVCTCVYQSIGTECHDCAGHSKSAVGDYVAEKGMHMCL